MFDHKNLELLSNIIIGSVHTVSVLVMLWGFVGFIKEFIIYKFKKNPRHDFLWYAQNLRLHLGTYIILALELMIIADVIETIFSQTYAHLIRLSAIVVIRTVLSYFLGKEITEAKEDIGDNVAGSNEQKAGA